MSFDRTTPVLRCIVVALSIFSTSCLKEVVIKESEFSPETSWEEAVNTIGPATYCIGILYQGKLLGVGSGFSINDSTIATNAHVVQGLIDVITNNPAVDLKPIAVRNGGSVLGSGFYHLNAFSIHPDYDEHSSETFDFGIVTTKGKMPSWAAFMSPQSLQQLSAGLEVGSIGFPGELNFLNTINPIATFKNGTISAVRAFGGATTTPLNGYYVQYNLNLSGGTSGSPVFNKKGEIFAINNSGIETMIYSSANQTWERIPLSSLDFGIRADRFDQVFDSKKTLFESLRKEIVEYTFINETPANLELSFTRLGVKDTVGYYDTITFIDYVSNPTKEPLYVKTLVATNRYLYWEDTISLGENFTRKYTIPNKWFMLVTTNSTNRTLRSVVVSNSLTYDSSSVTTPIGSSRDIGFYDSHSATTFRFYFLNSTSLIYWENYNTTSTTPYARMIWLTPSLTLSKTSPISSRPNRGRRHVYSFNEYLNSQLNYTKKNND